MPGPLLVNLIPVSVVAFIGILMYFLFFRPRAHPLPRWQRWVLWLAGVVLSFAALAAALYHFDPGRILGMSVGGFIAGIVTMLIWEQPSSRTDTKTK